MNQEEKAKAYDEALERMKSWVRGEHPECFGEAQKAAEFISDFDYINNALKLTELINNLKEKYEENN